MLTSIRNLGLNLRFRGRKLLSIFSHGVRLVLRPLFSLLYQPQMIDDGDFGAINAN
jgi:hypothetical protein